MSSKKQRVRLGDIELGDGNIYIQSMLNVIHSDIQGNVHQAIQLEEAGCEIVRVAIPNKESLRLIPAIKARISIPLVADIHFDHRLALESISLGVDKIRINPGNIGDDHKVEQVAKACLSNGVPIRIGVNAGSLQKKLLDKYGGPTPQALLESALYHCNLLNKFYFDNIVISIKSSNVKTMVKAYHLLSQHTNYPLHLGVTEAGTEYSGVIKSSIGIGAVLLRGIGDTIRVSLTADPVREVYAAKEILNSLGLYKKPCIEFISCPTCGRTEIDLIGLANRVQDRLKNYNKKLKVAIMGCVVNGPGEAKEADIGIAGGKNCGIIFKKGEIIKKVPENMLLDELIIEIDKM